MLNLSKIDLLSSNKIKKTKQKNKTNKITKLVKWNFIIKLIDCTIIKIQKKAVYHYCVQFSREFE